MFRSLLLRPEPSAGVDFVLSYSHFTLLDQTLDSLVPLLEQKGIGLINAAPLALGLLARRGPVDSHPASPSLRLISVRCRVYSPVNVVQASAVALCQSAGVSSERLGLQFALSHAPSSSVVVGNASPEHVKRNLEAYR